MGDIRLKQQTCHSQNGKTASGKTENGKQFVLSDVPKEELKKRRIPVYSYLM